MAIRIRRLVQSRGHRQTRTVAVEKQGWGLLNQFPPFLFPDFSPLKTLVTIISCSYLTGVAAYAVNLRNMNVMQII